jgi:hypothetical protein
MGKKCSISPTPLFHINLRALDITCVKKIIIDFIKYTKLFLNINNYLECRIIEQKWISIKKNKFEELSKFLFSISGGNPRILSHCIVHINNVLKSTNSIIFNKIEELDTQVYNEIDKVFLADLSFFKFYQNNGNEIQFNQTVQYLIIYGLINADINENIRKNIIYFFGFPSHTNLTLEEILIYIRFNVDFDRTESNAHFKLFLPKFVVKNYLENNNKEEVNNFFVFFTKPFYQIQ